MKYLLSITFFIILNFNLRAFEINTSITIQASPEQVWAVLTDFEAYPEWNPFLTSIEGKEFAEGKKISIIAGGMKFRPKILDYEENKHFRWVGRLLMPGIFDGKHRFELIDNGDGTTTLKHSEQFRGILVPFFKKKLEKDTKAGFEEMNRELKKRVELLKANT